MFASMWHAQTKRSDNDGIRLDTASFWEPRLHKQNYVRMSDYLPNASHPWVKQAKEKMPIFRPRIMVHYCTNGCHIEGRLSGHHIDTTPGWEC